MVRYADAEPNGLAGMVGRLIEANLERHPARRSLLRRAVIELTAPDAGVAATVRLAPGVVEIANGPASPGAHLRVRAASAGLVALVATPLRLGFPDPFRREGRAVLGELLGRRVRVSGVLRHPVRLSRFVRLLSVT